METQSTHPGRESGEDVGGVRQIVEYCSDLLMRGEEELSLEELRAERYFLSRHERLQQLTQLKQRLNRELQEKTRLLEQAPPPAGQVVPDPAPSTEHAQCPPAAAGDCQASTNKDVPILSEPRPPGPLHGFASKTLSPIQETSLLPEALDRTEAEPDPMGEEPDPMGEELDCQVSGTVPSAELGGGAVDPCDPELRQRLLEVCDITSCPHLHCESRPVPDMSGCLQLGGGAYLIHTQLVEHQDFSVYVAESEEDRVLVKVDHGQVPWDLHQFRRLKAATGSAPGLPTISCFRFLDGCVTVYAAPHDQLFTVLTEYEGGAFGKARLLLQLVSRLHSCGLLHGGLQPDHLVCSYRGSVDEVALFPLDWSYSVDLNLQQEVTSAQQLTSAQDYIRLGLLDPASPPQLVDLVGVAEVMHLLLTGTRIVPVKDAEGWTADHFREPAQLQTRTWRTWNKFFRSLLNPGDRPSMSILSDLQDLFE